MKNMHRIISLLVLIIGLAGAQALSESTTNLYILSFDNFNADPEIDWLKEGIVDYLMDYFKNKPGINVRRSSELQDLTQQFRSHPEFKTLKNYLLTGDFQRLNEQFEINLQLTDVNTWETIEKKKISARTTDLARVIELVNMGAAELVGLHLPQKLETKVVTALTETEKKPFRETIAATKQIAVAVDRLSNLYSAPISQSKTAESRLPFESVPDDDFNRRFSESISRSESFQDIIYRVARNPYKLEISDPLFKRQPLNEEMINVTFTIRFALNRTLVQDMLETFPYKSRDEYDDYIEYIYSSQNFLFQDNLPKTIAQGDLRFTPVISFVSDAGLIAGALIDISPAFSKNIKNVPNIKFVTKYQPLINLSASTTDLKINLKNKPTEVEYSLEMSLEQLQHISRIDVLFLSETEILDYLKTVK